MPLRPKRDEVPFVRTLLRALRPYRRQVAWGLIAAVLAATFDAISPMLLKSGVDSLQSGEPIGYLYAFCGLIVLAAAIAGLFRFWMRNIVIGQSRWVEFDIRQNYFAHLLRLAPLFFDRNHTGDLMARATDDIERVRLVVGPAMLYSTSTLLLLILSATMMIYLDPILAGCVFLLVPIIASAVLAVANSLHTANLLQQESYGQLTSQVQENLSGIRVIKAFSREDYEASRFHSICRQYYNRSMGVARIEALFMPLLGLIISLGVVGILWIGGQRVIAELITLGDFIAFIGYLSLMTWPMIAVGWVVHLYQRGAASHKRLDHIFGEKPQFEELSVIAGSAQQSEENSPDIAGDRFAALRHAHSDRITSPSITFRNVSFRYRDQGPDVLKGINLTIPAGSPVAIVGRTGSGKSSLVRLLPRLYEPQSGQILIDSIPIDRIPVAELRAQIGYVDQTPFIFSASIMENIGFGRAEATAEEIHSAAYAACLDQEVADFADGYNTLLGERGVTLSGGQQQRLTLARALLLDTPILVLDDSLSAVDADTEAEIIRQLSHRLQGRTTLIVTHRLAVAEEADSNIVLDKGRIVEQGTHSQLLHKEGMFAQMYRRQRLAEELGVMV